MHGEGRIVAQACQEFIRLTHCDGADRCTLGVFGDNLWWLQKLSLERSDLNSSIDSIKAEGSLQGACLYDSLCKSTDHLLEHGDKTRPWTIVAIVCKNDNKSTCSLYKCKEYMSTKFCSFANNSRTGSGKSRKENLVYIISVGNDIDHEELSSMAVPECMFHIHVKSPLALKNYLAQFSIATFGGLESAMDYVVLVDSSSFYSKPLPNSPSSAPLSKPREGITKYNKSDSMSSTAFSLCPDPAQDGTVPMQKDEATLDSQAESKLRSMPDPAIGLRQEAPSAYAESKPQVHVEAPQSGTREKPPAEHPEPKQQPVPSSVRAPVRMSKPVTIRMRRFTNRDLHSDDRQIFREFALDNYPGILTAWEEDEIVFLVLVESGARSIVGLLVMLQYDVDKLHIKLVVVHKEYRKHGFATNMLKYVAKEYKHKKVTLNVAFDRLDLLEFYYDKGLVKFEEFSTKNKVIVFSLLHWQ